MLINYEASLKITKVVNQYNLPCSISEMFINEGNNLTTQGPSYWEGGESVGRKVSSHTHSLPHPNIAEPCVTKGTVLSI